MIHRLKFSIDIKARKSRIWSALWEETAYRDWASVFYEGSYAVTNNWEEGSTVLFLAPNQSGIYSIIETNVPNTVMGFRHVGKVLKGKEQPMDDETKKWSGATEVYTVTEGADSNTLTVEIDVLDEHLDFMTTTFPKALEKVKHNCSG
ncbi:MAG: hypothetical protein AAF489_11160 [Bacteroidota bacterium]